MRIVGPDTDLRLGVEGRSWQPADGRYNMPDGEVYTSPLETVTEGDIRFTFPALFHGREVDGHPAPLRGRQGRRAEAARGVEYLEALLDVDEGARRLGEVAFGLNYEIDRFTRNTLFDEKIGGTMHVALGSAFEELGGENTPRCTGTWSATCARTARCTPTASSIWRARALPRAARDRRMSDSRLARLADVLVGYSGRVSPASSCCWRRRWS